MGPTTRTAPGPGPVRAAASQRPARAQGASGSWGTPWRPPRISSSVCRRLAAQGAGPVQPRHRPHRLPDAPWLDSERRQAGSGGSAAGARGCPPLAPPSPGSWASRVSVGSGCSCQGVPGLLVPAKPRTLSTKAWAGTPDSSWTNPPQPRGREAHCVSRTSAPTHLPRSSPRGPGKGAQSPHRWDIQARRGQGRAHSSGVGWRQSRRVAAGRGWAEAVRLRGESPVGEGVREGAGKKGPEVGSPS